MNDAFAVWKRCATGKKQSFFVHFRLEKGIEITQQFVDRSGGQMQLHLTCFDKRNIDKVVNKTQHAFATLLNQIDIFALFLFGHIRFLQQLSKAKNAIHRGAYLMTDIGQKC